MKRLRAHPPAGPVIVAGSTGSIPATAELISAIADLPNGAVVLPGLDRDLDDAAWQMLASATDNPSTFGHPQFGLRKLLDAMQTLRADVEHLDDMPASKRLRERVVSEALRPAETTDAWGQLARDPDMQPTALRQAAQTIDLIETANEREEALTVALVLRDAINDEGKTAALVTADRNLARRVVGELARFGIDADDSGGRHLRDVETTTLLRLLVETVFNPGDPVALLALVKHPLLRLEAPASSDALLPKPWNSSPFAVARAAHPCSIFLHFRPAVGGKCRPAMATGMARHGHTGHDRRCPKSLRKPIERDGTIGTFRYRWTQDRDR